jgi:hypothetical protein
VNLCSKPSNFSAKQAFSQLTIFHNKETNVAEEDGGEMLVLPNIFDCFERVF